MKKILAALLLLTFCTAQGTWAGDVLIIGSDGQARYEDESKNITVSQKVIENTKPKNILNEVTITDDTGKRESIYIDHKGKVKKVEEGQMQSTSITVDTEKEAEYQRIVKNAPQTLRGAYSILSLYGYGIKDNSIKSYKEYTKMNLLDGDYVIAYKDVPYIAEYHKDGELMGLVSIEKKELSEKKGSAVFYEYRVGYNTTSGMGLKHVLFLDFENGKYIAQYIYKHDGKLLCRQINNDIYVASEARNMLPNWSNKVEVKTFNQAVSKTVKQQNNNIKKENETWKTVGKVGGGILFAPVIIAAVPLVILFDIMGFNVWGH